MEIIARSLQRSGKSELTMMERLKILEGSVSRGLRKWSGWDGSLEKRPDSKSRKADQEIGRSNQGL